MPVVGIGTPPTPNPQASVPPPFGTGGRGTLAGERGVGKSHFRRGDIHCSPLYEYIYVLCGINEKNFCNILYRLCGGTNTTLYSLFIPPAAAAYPHAEREYFHETLEAEEAGQRGVHVMQDRFVRFGLFVVLKRKQL